MCLWVCLKKVRCYVIASNLNSIFVSFLKESKNTFSFLLELYIWPPKVCRHPDIKRSESENNIIKVLHKIIGYDKNQRKLYNDLQRIGSIRNSFAHTNFSYVMNFSFGPHDESKQWSDQVINVMKPNGEIDSKNPLEFLEEYLDLLKKLNHNFRKFGMKQAKM